MEEKAISSDEWKGYLKELYNWVSDKYEKYANGDIDKIEYEENLAYYQQELERIDAKFNPPQKREDPKEEAKEEEKEEKQPGSFLSQSTFEDFFGITAEGDKPLKEEEEILEDIILDTPSYHDEYETQDEFKKDISEELEQLVEQTHKRDVSVYAEEEPPAVELDFEEFKQPDMYTMSLLLIGDSAVGRSSIRRNFMGKNFIPTHLTTIAATMDKKQVTFDERKYALTIIDLGGQDFYEGVRKNFYRNVSGAVIVFDLTRRETFMRLDYWAREFLRSVKELKPFIIVGNKADAKKRKITKKEGEKVALNFSRFTMPKFRVRYYETSAKDTLNIHEIFSSICNEIRLFEKFRSKIGDANKK